MTTIWKFPLDIATFQEVSVPLAAEPIHAGLDANGEPSIWCEVNSSDVKEKIHVYLVGTGHSLPERARQHVGSFVHGPFVWHVYTP